MAPGGPAVLFRYPGPCGLNDHLGLGLVSLGPPGTRALWLAEEAWHDDVPGVPYFGTLALLEPWRTRPRATERAGIYVGRNEPERKVGRYIWIPPSWVARHDLADRLRRGEAPAADDERRRVLHSVHAYLEELGTLRLAGGDPPGQPWCRLDGAERRRRLGAVGVRPLWTGLLDEPVRLRGAA
jgi:hypothetical protein